MKQRAVYIDWTEEGMLYLLMYHHYINLLLSPEQSPPIALEGFKPDEM